MLLDFEYNEVGNRWNNNGYCGELNVEPNNVHEKLIGGWNIRQLLTQYFISPQRSVPWQWELM